MQNVEFMRNSPWPTDGEEDVCFILDARTSLERELLERWIEAYPPVSNRSWQKITLSLRFDRVDFDASPLVKVLQLPPQTLITPLRVFWQPATDLLHSAPRIRDLLFGDPRRPSALIGRRIAKKSPERVHLIRGQEDSVERLMGRFAHQYGEGSEQAADAQAEFVAQQATLALDIAGRQLRGGRYKVPRHVAASLRGNKSYLDSIKELAQEQGTSVAKLMEEAAGYMREMVSFPSTFWLDVYAKFNEFMLGRGYNKEVIVNPDDLARLRTLVRQHPSLLLWTHKTYLDGSVIPKVMYENDFPMPHIIGGANMSFAGLGFLLRRSGGIFIRRSFQDNPLYKLTLRHYIGMLMEKRFPLTWSFEGTRSRIGKLMPPRYGILKYVLEACYSADFRQIQIVPLSISYDIIRDVDDYAAEQTGKSKAPESLSWFIGYVRSLGKPMGKIYLDIGEPVVLKQAPQPDDRLALSKIAFQVAVETNKVTPITFPALVCMSLLGAAPRALTEAEVIQDLRSLLAYADQRRLRLSPDFDRAYADHIDGLLGIMINEGMVTRYDQGPDIVYGIAPEQHPTASYYRNMIIHFFVTKAITEMALLKASRVLVDTDAKPVFWAEVENLRNLFKFEFFYAPTEEFQAEVETELARYCEDCQVKLDQGASGFGQILDCMSPLVGHTTLSTFVESYSVVADLLARMEPVETLEAKDAVERAINYGRQAYLQRRINSEASIGKILFKNGYDMLSHRALTAGGDADLGDRRREMARELQELSVRLETLKAMASAKRAAASNSL